MQLDSDTGAYLVEQCCQRQREHRLAGQIPGRGDTLEIRSEWHRWYRHLDCHESLRYTLLGSTLRRQLGRSLEVTEPKGSR